MMLISSASFGQEVSDLSLLNVINGQEVRLTGKTVVPIFFCNGCPYSAYYINRINQLAEKFESVEFVLVNPSPDEYNKKETIEEMRKFASENDVKIPYLTDKNQDLFNLLGASKCPEVFVLSKSGNEYKVNYRGAIDDNPQVENQVKVSYLEEAIRSALKGAAPKLNSTRPLGCVVKKSR